MYICSATLKSSELGDSVYKITTTPEEDNENADEEIAKVYYTKPIADKIMKAITYDNKSFECNGIKWEIVKYSTNSEFEKYCPYNHKKQWSKYSRKVDFSDTTKLHKIYVYNVKSICPHCYGLYGFGEDVESVIADIPLEHNHNKIVPVNIQYCNRCKRYFTNKYSLEGYEERLGILLFYRIHEDYTRDGRRIKPSDFAETSILSDYGYTVRSGELSQTQRQRILRQILDDKAATKAYIINKLSEFINVRENRYDSDRFTNAIRCWKQDIHFVNEYNVKNQNHIGTGSLYSWKNEKKLSVC